MVLREKVYFSNGVIIFPEMYRTIMIDDSFNGQTIQYNA